MRAFSPVTCEAEFFPISGLDREAENAKVFLFRLVPAKNNKML